MAIIRTKRTETRSMSGAGHGLTLVEAVISILIVAVMLVAVLSTLGGVARSHLVQKAFGKEQALGMALLTEVLGARYEDANAPGGWGPESGESSTPRTDFDDVDDYDGWTASPPQKNDGTQLAACAGWRRSVSVTLVNPGTLNASSPSDLGLRKIEVTVEDPQGNSTVLSALRSRYGVGEKAPVQDTTFVTWVGVDLQTGGNASNRLGLGASLANQPTAQ